MDRADAPTVFAIFILGIVVVPAAFGLEALARPPMWVHMVVWPPVIVGLAIALLRPMKATIVALHYNNLRHEYHDPD